MTCPPRTVPLGERGFDFSKVGGRLTAHAASCAGSVFNISAIAQMITLIPERMNTQPSCGLDSGGLVLKKIQRPGYRIETKAPRRLG
jgi:hypothetical protein